MVQLFFLVHGFAGVSQDLECMKAHIEQACPNPKSIRVHCASAHEYIKTLDSIEIGAQRTYRELLEVCDESIDRISFIGYSMGGLVTRKLIGLLEVNGFWESTGIQRGFYASFATPHLGARRVHGGGGFKQFLFNCVGEALLGVSGREMWQNGSSGILAELADPKGDAYRGLEKFYPLILVANAADDRSVKFWTSFITTKEPFENVHAVEYEYFDRPGGSKVGSVLPLLDLQECKHITDEAIIESNEEMAPESSGLSLRFVMLVLPITLVVSTLSARSALRELYMKHHWGARFSKALSHQREIAEKRQAGHLLEASSTAGSAEKAIAGALQEVVDDPDPVHQFHARRDTTNGEKMHSKNYPRPLVGSCEFIESSVSESKVSKAKKGQIAALNSLPWNKYVAKFPEHTWTHAAIVNRHNQPNSPGNPLLAYFAALFHTFYPDPSGELQAAAT